MGRPTTASRCSKEIRIPAEKPVVTCNKTEGHAGPCQGTVKGPPRR
jgi:hypothetical protein